MHLNTRYSIAMGWRSSPSVVRRPSRVLHVLRELDPLVSLITLYLTTRWVTNGNTVYLHALMLGTCFRVLDTLIFLYEHCFYITYYSFLIVL